MVDTALARWATSDLGSGALSALSAPITVELADLPGLTLGQVVGETILLDYDAAGHGWFIDTTPADDAEFSLVRPEGLAAMPGSPAAGGMDLLTVVMHEIGHVLGFEDHEVLAPSDDLMSATLPTGVRRDAAPHSAVDALERSGAPATDQSGQPRVLIAWDTAPDAGAQHGPRATAAGAVASPRIAWDAISQTAPDSAGHRQAALRQRAYAHLPLLPDDVEQLWGQPAVRSAEITNGTPGEKPGFFKRARAFFGAMSRS